MDSQPPADRAASEGEALPSGVARAERVASASAWTVSSMGAMSVLRLVSQMVLSYLVVPEYFGVIALMRTFLVLLEMLSDVGIRASVVYHRAGEDSAFLNTAWTLQILRGVVMWVMSCALAWPVARFYDAPILMWLLPVAGLEAINNGLLSVRIFTHERRLRLRVPVLLDWVGLLVSIATTLIWAWIHPSVWALAAGPLVGGVAKTSLSHYVLGGERLRLAWQRDHVRSLVDFGKWVIGGTMVSFVAQQFHILYLGKFLLPAILGVYQVAWNFCVQASKPMTMLSNRVMIPHYADFARRDASEHTSAVRHALGKFLPACLLVCVGTGLVCPALFGFFYERAFVDGGRMGRLLAVVVWFMILQHVPRSALLSLGDSRGVAGMALVNALCTVGGIVAGFAVTRGLELPYQAVSGAVIGNAVGNVAGCVYGARAAHGHGVRFGATMAGYSVLFLSILGAGVLLGAWSQWPRVAGLSERMASLVTSIVICVPLTLIVWRRTGKEFFERRRAAKAPAPVR